MLPGEGKSNNFNFIIPEMFCCQGAFTLILKGGGPSHVHAPFPNEFASFLNANL